jgi:hypothetical protein
MSNNNDLDQLGFGGSAMPRYDLNLAGGAGVPTPDQLVQRSHWNVPLPPDYGLPDFSTPTLKGNDLADAGLNLIPEFEPDPSIPDLRAIPQPFAVDMPDGMQSPPMIAQDIPGDEEIARSLYPGLGFPGLTINRDVREPDPSIPDLQHPDLRPQVSMAPDERPGELDPSALDVMHASIQYEQVRDKQYPAVQMDQHGMNNHRSRDFTMLMKGLDNEERER